MEMQFKNEIKKLADIVVWADNWITELKDGLTEEEFEEDAEVKEFEAVKKVVLESIDRHTTYTNALNKDIADKASKIDLLEKEIEGRKEGYVALKERMDTKYISIDEHNKICKAYEEKVAELEKELADCKVKIRHQKENLDGINKTLEIRTKENERLIAVKNNQQKEIEAHESENARLSEKIMELKKELDESYKAVEELHGSIHRLTLNCRSKNTEIARLAKEHSDIRHELAKRVAESEFNEEDDHGRAGFERYIKYLIEEEEGKFKARFKARLNKEITEIFEKEEETKVNGIPCGEDAIE